jgi:hypothetical protein
MPATRRTCAGQLHRVQAGKLLALYRDDRPEPGARAGLTDQWRLLKWTHGLEGGIREWPKAGFTLVQDLGVAV